METSLVREISASEKQLAIQDLTATREKLLAELDGLTEEQWIFKPAPDRWSIAENVQHLTEVEGRVHGILANLKDCAETPAGRNESDVDQFLRKTVLDRTKKVEASLRSHPFGTWTLGEARDRFDQNRQRSLDLLEQGECLRGHVFPHPIFGPWDGYQWLLAAAGHGARHTLQIIEIKQDPSFPPS